MKLKHLAGACALGLTSFALSAPTAAAFCGFYVAKADTDLFNDASKVVLVRDDERTVTTMASDYRGEASEFAARQRVGGKKKDRLNLWQYILFDRW